MPIPLPDTVTLVAAPPPPSNVDMAYELTRTAIYDGFLQPRERIVVNEIAAAAECSRTPVLSALDRLAAERLIVKRGATLHGYFHVVTVDPGEAADALAALTIVLRALNPTDATLLKRASASLETLPGCRESSTVDLARSACMAVAVAAPNQALALALARSLEPLLFRATRA